MHKAIYIAFDKTTISLLYNTNFKNNMFKQFGASPTEKDLKIYKISPNWKKGKFVNLISIGIGLRVSSTPNS